MQQPTNLDLDADAFDEAVPTHLIGFKAPVDKEATRVPYSKYPNNHPFAIFRGNYEATIDFKKGERHKPDPTSEAQLLAFHDINLPGRSMEEAAKNISNDLSASRDSKPRRGAYAAKVKVKLKKA